MAFEIGALSSTIASNWPFMLLGGIAAACTWNRSKMIALRLLLGASFAGLVYNGFRRSSGSVFLGFIRSGDPSSGDAMAATHAGLVTSALVGAIGIVAVKTPRKVISPFLFVVGAYLVRVMPLFWKGWFGI